MALIGLGLAAIDGRPLRVLRRAGPGGARTCSNLKTNLNAEATFMATAVREHAQSGLRTLRARLDDLDGRGIERDLDALGYATTGPLLTPEECAAVAGMYGEPARFRSRIDMRRHAFGEGEYQYFAYPLPEIVAELRARDSIRGSRRSPIAGARRSAAASPIRRDLDGYLERCHAAGQRRPTPLLLKYGAGDYNRLHQDLYGELHFPLQMAILLSAPGRDFTGGEFVLTEQRPRTQSRVEVVPLVQGEAVIFAVNFRPTRGARGYYRVAMRHGVSRLRSGSRYTLGIIFHDAA